MKKLMSIGLLAVLTIVLVSAPMTFAAKASSATTLLGLDVSWPQCGKSLPSNQAFGIVGVNGGLATTTNTCLKDQLVWANKSLGGVNQDKAQLYLNTANPGGLNTTSWPKDSTDPAGNTTSNPHGICDGSDSLACAWQYGWNRALEDVQVRFQPAATQAGVTANPASYLWWLDVETQNTWKTGGTLFDYQSNVAVLEGMTAQFVSVGGRVGLYSTAAQWSQIVGKAVTSNSNLNSLPNWRPGGASLSTAKSACKAASLTANGTVVLTQYVSKGLDYDYSCI